MDSKSSLDLNDLLADLDLDSLPRLPITETISKEIILMNSLEGIQEMLDPQKKVCWSALRIFRVSEGLLVWIPKEQKFDFIDNSELEKTPTQDSDFWRKIYGEKEMNIDWNKPHYIEMDYGTLVWQYNHQRWVYISEKDITNWGSW